MKFNDLVKLAENAFKCNNIHTSKRYWDEAKTKLQTVSHFDGSGLLHKDGGPAVIWYDNQGYKEMERWVKHGINHRLDGPAWIYYYPDDSIRMEEYFINDKKYTKEEFDEYVKGLDKDQLDLLNDLGQTFD